MFGRLQLVWQKATRPHPEVKDIEARRAAATTLGMLAVVLPLDFATAILFPLVFNRAEPLADDLLFQIAAAVFPVYILAYVLAKSRRPFLGSSLLCWGMVVATWVFVLVSERDYWHDGSTTFLLFPVIVASLTLRLPQAILLAVANVAGLVLYVVGDRAPTHVAALLMLLAVPPLLFTGTAIRRQQVQTIENQTRLLQKAHSDALALIEAAPHAMLTVDGDGRISYANQPCAVVFGYTRAELVGLNVDCLVPAALRAAHPGHRAAFTKDPRPRHIGSNRDLFGERKDGSQVPVEVGINVLDTSEGRFYVASIVDLTERRRAEGLQQDVFKARTEADHLAAIAKFRADMMNMVAHELKNPLTPIKLEAKILEADSLTPESKHRALDVLGRNVRRLQTQIDHMLEASRLESGTVKLASKEGDVSALVVDACESAKVVADEAGLRLEWQVEPALVANVDRPRLLQVLDNLISNAIKYTPNPGSIQVKASRADGHVRVEVSDTGLGLSADQIRRLFAPFSRVHEPVRKTASGTGLGLYISKGLIELQGGRLGVRSEGPAKGSTFWFELPAVG